MPRINHNIPAMITSTALNQNNSDMQTSLERLSTGLRINRAADDAAGLSVSEQLTTQVNGLDQAGRNIQDGTALLNTAEGATNEIESMLQRMRELAVQASNDTLTSVERGYIQIETTELTSEVDRITGSTQYNNQNLLDGSAPWGQAPGGVLHVGPNNNINGDDEVQFVINPMDSVSLGINALDMTTQTNAAASINTLDTALQSVNELRADLGAKTNRLSHALNNQQNQEENMQAAESVIRDTDFATETTQYTRSQILTQSATAMLAQANSAPKSVLSLLGGQ